MKKPTLTLLALLALTLTGCQGKQGTHDNVVHYNAYWDILRLNDSTLLIVPNSADIIPIIKRITHDPGCPCQQQPR